MTDDSQTVEWIREPERCVSSFGSVRLMLPFAQTNRDQRFVYFSWEDAAVADNIPSGLGE